MKRKVYLTGYEKESIDDFVSKLLENNVSFLVDVRELPLSRKKGFSKTRLKERLEAEGIQYCHLRSLGSPRKLRKELRNNGDYLHFFKKYRVYVRGKHFELEKLVKKSVYESLCIMCFEKDCELCHRSIIADEIQQMEPQIKFCSI